MKKNKLLFFIAAIILFPACKDIFERNLEKSTISLQTPPDNLKSNLLTIVFSWDEVKGASEYRFEIGSPNFNNITQLVVDTPIPSTQFSYTLKPGSYCWRVRASNNSSFTEYTTRCLTVDSLPDLALQEIVLSGPADNFATKNPNITFRWYPLLNSDDYRFELRSPDFNGSLKFPVTILQDTSVSVTGLPEGKYEWGVRGQNTLSNTLFSKNKLFIDSTAPAVPLLVSPAANDTLDGSSMDFTWTQLPDSGSVVSDSVWIFSDSAATLLKKEYFTVGQSRNVDTLNSGAYFWRIRAMDAAGNKSSLSILRKFFVQ